MMTDQEIIMQLYRDENIAMVAKDLNKLNQILAIDMQLIHMTGYVQPKLEWIDQIQNGDLQYYSSQEDTISDLQVKGNTAHLIGRNRVQASVWGSATSNWRLQMKVSYRRQNGHWLITKQVASTY